ncbi:hypothetical protein, partial [Photorhabdus australis]|uniref:hypothetical protein n=1 Tax=Photorhabdus australis TaxID=286156 RepID=UPI001969B225
KTFLLVLANPTFSHLDILDQMTYLGQPQIKYILSRKSTFSYLSIWSLLVRLGYSYFFFL